MQITRLCKTCKNEFIARKTTQWFCCRRCFKKDYYQKIKQKNIALDKNPKVPLKTCVFCGKLYHVPFDPIKFPKLFDQWRCPFCGISNQMIWKFSEKQNSRQLIFQAILELRTGDTTIRYEQKIIL